MFGGSESGGDERPGFVVVDRLFETIGDLSTIRGSARRMDSNVA